jgi:cytidylate kinase
MLITVSRQYSTNGILIACMVAERLNIPLFDHELVDELARQLQVNPVTVDHLYATMSRPVEALLLEWRSAVSPETYARYLGEAITRIAAKGDAVVLGRGGNFALHGIPAFRVRIVAPFELRVAIYRAGNEFTEAQARHDVALHDKERVDFVHRVFHHSVDDPHNYDLTINLSCITPESATELILHAVRAHQACAPDAPVTATMPEHLRMMIKAKHHVRPEIVERKH